MRTKSILELKEPPRTLKRALLLRPTTTSTASAAEEHEHHPVEEDPVIESSSLEHSFRNGRSDTSDSNMTCDRDEYDDSKIDRSSATTRSDHQMHPHNLRLRNKYRIATLQVLMITISLSLLLQQQHQQQSPTDTAFSNYGRGNLFAEAVPAESSTLDTSSIQFHVGSSSAIARHQANTDRERRRLLATDESETNQRSSVIIVATVDGTLAGISKASGEVLWKRSSSTSHSRTSRSNVAVLRPLVSTTTTKLSVKQLNHAWKTAAVPSIDGSVYLTASSEASLTTTSTETTCNRNNEEEQHMLAQEVTVTTSLPDLVARAPFVDARGRIYTGSRQSTTFAIDSNSGELVHVFPDGDHHQPHNFFPTEGTPRWSDDPNNDDVSSSIGAATSSSRQHHQRSVVWLGRVDYAVSVHEPQSGQLDVQFGAGTILGAHDMWLGSSGNNHHPPDQEPWSETPPIESRLMATPNGNVAFRIGGNDGSKAPIIEWVANECFDSPVAFAIDAATGKSLPVDIFPDAAVPHGTSEYVSKEMERQMQRVLQLQEDKSSLERLQGVGEDDGLESSPEFNDEQTIVGSLSTGDLFALPLGRREYYHTSDGSTTLGTATGYLPGLHSLHPNHHHSGVASSSSSASAAAASKSSLHVARVPGKHPSSLQQHSHHHHRHYHPTDTKQGHGPCDPGDPNFPNCLARKPPPNGGGTGGGSSSWPVHTHFLSETIPANDDPNVAALVVKYQYPDPGSGWYIPPPHYYTIVTPPHKRQKRYQKLLRILGSWLPPTIALLFVVSFEFGRRKRQERRLLHGTQNELNQSILSPLTNGRNTNEDRDSSIDTAAAAKVESIGLIQVFDDVILGYGCHGTVVYKGMLEGRQVAVKRMLRAYHASADREILLLIESDGHPNVVRYFLKEVRGDFVYLALELCDLSLHDLVQKLKDRHDQYEKENLTPPSVSDATRTVLFQIASGVKHLHRLRIVHRDLKPMNILLADSRNKSSRKYKDTEQLPVCQVFESGFYVAKISDMGLGKQLMGQSSYGGSLIPEGSLRGVSNGGQSSMIGMGPGSVGWQAPEVMALRTLPSDASARSEESIGAAHQSSCPDASPIDVAINARTSRSVDIFSLGCVFYSTLIPGCHPFGEWYERESNIMRNKPSIQQLEEVSPDAFDLVASMIHRNPQARPTAAQICVHPFFWDAERRMSFLCDFSDRIECEGLQPESSSSPCDAPLNAIALLVERNASKVVGLSWETLLDDDLVSNVQRFRTYDSSSVRDLLRLIRNKYHHFDELPSSMKLSLGSKAEGLVRYFEVRFPRLLIHCFNICRELLPIDDSLCQKYAIVPAYQSMDKSVATRTTTIRNSVDSSVVGQHPESSCAPPPEASRDATIITANTETPEEASDMALSPPPDVVECDNKVDVHASSVSATNHLVDVDVDVDAPELLNDTANAPELLNDVANEPSQLAGSVPDDVVVWEGSTAARAFHCRGWSRSDAEWERRTDAKLRKRDANLVRCAEDPKFRTRLCNYWDLSLGTSCPMRKKNKCIFAHGPIELRVKDGKRHRWGKLVDKNGDNNNPHHSGGEDTYGAARLIEKERHQEGKWGKSDKKHGNTPSKGKKVTKKKT